MLILQTLNVLYQKYFQDETNQAYPPVIKRKLNQVFEGSSNSIFEITASVGLQPVPSETTNLGWIVVPAPNALMTELYS